MDICFRKSVCALVLLLVSGAASTAAAQDESGARSDETTSEPSEQNDSGETVVEAEDTRFVLSDLLDRTKNNSDLLAEFEAKRDKAEWQQYRAKWAWTPEITSTSTLAPVPADADPDQIQNNVDEIGDLEIGPFFNQDVRVAMPLYTFGKISTARELAALGLDANELERKKARLDMIFQVKRAFWGLQLSTTFSEMLQEGDERIEKQLEEMDAARDFGEADFEIEDFRKLEIFSAEVDTRIVDNRKLAEVARAGIQYLAEIDSDESVDVGKLEEDADPPGLKPLSYYLTAAKKMRPEMEQLRTAVEARRLEARLQRNQWYPDVFAAFTFGFGWSTENVSRQEICVTDDNEECIAEEQDRLAGLQDGERLTAEPYREPFDRLSVGIGVGLRWKINPIQQHGKHQEKQAQLRALLAQKRRAEGAIELEVRKIYQDASDSLEKISINERRVEAARRWRDQLGISIETAGADIEDAVEPLKAFYQARALYLETRFNYLVARAELAKAVGAFRLGDDGAVREPVQP